MTGEKFFQRKLIVEVGLAYLDTFWILAGIALVMFGFSFRLKRNSPGAGGTMAVG